MKITKLNATNYQHWKLRMEMVLLERDLWDVVSGEVSDDVLDSKRLGLAFAAIALNVEDDQLNHIKAFKNDGRRAWLALENIHQPKGPVHAMFLYKKLFRLRLAGDGDMRKHLDAFDDLMNQLSAVTTDRLPEELVGTLLLNSVTDAYENLVVAIEAQQVDSISVEYIKSRLMSEYVRRSDETNTEENVLVSRDKPSKTRPRNTYSCEYCHKKGHTSDRCYKKAYDLAKKDEQANIAVEESAYAADENTISKSVSSKSSSADSAVWLLDSGCSQHMCKTSNFLSDPRDAGGRKINFGNDGVLAAKLYGTVTFDKPFSGKFTDVLFVPGIAYNLISVRQLASRGYRVVFANKRATVYSPANKVLFEVPEVDGLFAVSVRLLSCNSSYSLPALVAHSNGCVWHRRLGHPGVSAMKQLANSGSLREENSVAVESLKSSNSIVCEPCQSGKQSRLPFGVREYTATCVLELLHIDLCGPIEPKSLSGCSYFMMIVDDYSRKFFVCFLRNKSDAFDAFVDIKVKLERQTGKPVKKIRSDNGGEFVNRHFGELCRREGIDHQLSVPYTPQQNGVVERANRTVVEKTRCMLADCNLNNKFWAEAVNTAVYLYNRLPSSAIDWNIPEERWTGMPQSYKDLRVFGCAAYAYAKTAKLKKLDPRSVKCVFLGYCSDRKAFRLYSLETRRLVISRDVTFDESVFPSFDDWECADLTVVYGSQNQGELVNGPRVPNQDRGSVQLSDSQSVVSSSDMDLTVHSGGSVNGETLDSAEGDDMELTVHSGESVGHGMLDNIDPVACEDPEVGDTSEDPLLIQETTSDEFVYLSLTSEPTSYSQVLDSAERAQWEESMDAEMKAMEDNNVWKLVKLPPGRTAVGSKWVYKKKTDFDGSVTKFKSRIVAKGYSQRGGIDYHETFAPAAKFTSIRIILALAAHYDWELEQMDVKTAFLNGDLEEEIYLQQPEGRTVEGKPSWVYKLNKALYGLKQSPRAWNKKLVSVFENVGLVQSPNDPSLFMLSKSGSVMFVIVHVDDLLIAGSDIGLVRNFKEHMKNVFKMEDLCAVKQLLGMHIVRDRKNRTLFLEQSKYIKNILSRFGMDECKDCDTPMVEGFHSKEHMKSAKFEQSSLYASLIGSLMYAALGTRPDIIHAVVSLSRFNNKCTQEHWQAAKRILRYLHGTQSAGIMYRGGSLEGYSDAEWGGDHVDRRSTGGYVFKLYGGAVSWQSKKQETVAQSSTEAEYIAVNGAAREFVWLKRVLCEIGENVECPFKLYEDNRGCIDLSKNPEFHARSKHIDIKHHYIRELVQKKEIELKYCRTEEMVADVMTKPLGRQAHRKLSLAMGIELGAGSKGEC